MPAELMWPFDKLWGEWEQVQIVSNKHLGVFIVVIVFVLFVSFRFLNFESFLCYWWWDDNSGCMVFVPVSKPNCVMLFCFSNAVDKAVVNEQSADSQLQWSRHAAGCIRCRYKRRCFAAVQNATFLSQLTAHIATEFRVNILPKTCAYSGCGFSVLGSYVVVWQLNEADMW